jgi:hypothetical protein
MKLLSRRFWLAVLYVVLTICNKKWNLGLSDVDIISAGGTVVTYILGESYNDSKKGNAK